MNAPLQGMQAVFWDWFFMAGLVALGLGSSSPSPAA